MVMKRQFVVDRGLTFRDRNLTPRGHDNPVISVIISTCKRPELLRRALRSLRSQRDASWEALVMDSGDGEGLKVARGFGDHRIRAYRNPGFGEVAARNAALEIVRGAVIAFLNDCDWWEDPQHLSRICEALRGGEALLYRTGWVVREDNSAELERVPYDLCATRDSLRRDNTLLSSGIAYPTVMHDWLGGFDAGMGHYWDWDWSLRLMQEGAELRRIPGSSVCVSLHSEGETVFKHAATKTRDLALLAQKHGLHDLQLKNHLSLTLEAQSSEMAAD
jgi:glycosyltransferase involved in cell wall biosynthesis